ncbi:NADP-dependent oxidoreductase [Nonlabens arenilitoris]|uniref:NADP-dependent oxidoreductase n=1 Tax=Nonlabens arenilitoris TaxID=1217969 RepID=A0A2S7UA39_9FLAO|nr:NADP-dependent oxidoreductase [Nonlabens arenilitoris]PQJ31795.1 NADP-dependent oxidoreductase [Nonlabens arenilitoris]
MSKTIILKQRPDGKPKTSDFEIIKEGLPSIETGEILLKAKYVSVDPYLRGRMRNEKSYIEPFKINEPIASTVVAEVVESKNDKFSDGDFLTGMLDWKEYQVHTGENLRKINGDNISLSAYLGVLGLTGLTAYFGLKKIGEPKEGETLLVSGAAGAVGSIVGQIGKIKGLRVIGIAGSDEKVTLLKEQLGFDAAINYNTTDDMAAAIKKHAPDGIDVYFDNVGSYTLDAAMENINRFGRVINCGAISLYNETDRPTGPRLETTLVKKSVKMQGFIVRNFEKDFPEGIQQLSTWLKEGKLKHEETIVEGFETIPQAFINLFDGKNKGKMLVKIY